MSNIFTAIAHVLPNNQKHLVTNYEQSIADMAKLFTADEASQFLNKQEMVKNNLVAIATQLQESLYKNVIVSDLFRSSIILTAVWQSRHNRFEEYRVQPIRNESGCVGSYHIRGRDFQVHNRAKVSPITVTPYGIQFVIPISSQNIDKLIHVKTAVDLIERDTTFINTVTKYNLYLTRKEKAIATRRDLVKALWESDWFAELEQDCAIPGSGMITHQNVDAILEENPGMYDRDRRILKFVFA